MNINKQRVLLRALSLIPHLGPVSIIKIMRIYPNLEDLWQDSNTNINRNIGSIIAGKVFPAIYNINAYKLEEEINSSDIKYITILDSKYPYLLKQIYDPPVVIYFKGNIDAFTSNNYLAVVGPRKISSYGLQTMPFLLNPIVKHDITIVSGLALGVDSEAHKMAVKNNKPTIAVLGGGIDNNSLYPKQNFHLAREIIDNNGLIISEYPPGTRPKPQNFPRRNRVISGLCQASLIIEAAERSGSLITAYQALEQNREVLAVPGNILLTNSLGTNKLLQRGARPIMNSNDILEVYN